MSLAIVIYFIPTIVANYLEHKNTAAIGVLNLFLGWTLLGWIRALVRAFATPDPK